MMAREKDEAAVVYDTWPDDAQWQFHRRSFQPFHAKNISRDFPSYPIAELLRLHEKTETEKESATETEAVIPADILCTPTGKEFSGEESKLEFISLNLIQFLEGFQASQQGHPHWLQNLTDIQLYLSQLSLSTFYSLLHIPCPPLPSPIVTSLSGGSQSYQVDGNIWMNITSVQSSLHYDGNHNILIVCQGWKEITLLSPEYSSLLSGHPISSVACNHSHLSHEKMEEIIQLHSLPCLRIRLEEGEALFIPEGWWHQVCSGSCTYAINYWFPSPFHEILSLGSFSLPLPEEGQDSSVNLRMLPYLMRKCLQNILSTQLKNEPTSRREESLTDTALSNLFQEADPAKLRDRFSKASLREMSLHWLPFSKQVCSVLATPLLSHDSSLLIY
jgi:hypothetical protein